MPRRMIFGAPALLLASLLPLNAFAQSPSGDSIIRGKAGSSEIVIKTTSRLAGAIDSVTWGGKEFINSFDHGRQLQSASNFDVDGEFFPEVFNPTEAGSMSDGRGKTSTSKLLKLRASDSELETTNQMAFWLRPGEKSLGNPARNTKALSDHLLTKRVRLGDKDLPHAIEYRVTFTLPEGESHTYAQFEALTGYMPPEFSKFLTYDRASGDFKPLSDGPGEQSAPVVLSTPDGSHAMGVFTAEPNPGYGRFRFVSDKVVKWNCVFRIRDPAGIKPGDYTYTMYALVGSLEDVRRTMKALHER